VSCILSILTNGAFCSYFHRFVKNLQTFFNVHNVFFHVQGRLKSPTTYLIFKFWVNVGVDPYVRLLGFISTNTDTLLFFSISMLYFIKSNIFELNLHFTIILQRYLFCILSIGAGNGLYTNKLSTCTDTILLYTIPSYLYKFIYICSLKSDYYYIAKRWIFQHFS